MMPYQLIVFDWDGTLHNSGDHIIKSFQAAAETLHLPIPTVEAIRDVVGLNFESAIDQLFPILQQTNQVAAFKQAVRKHAGTYVPLPSLFDGAKNVLKQLHKSGYWLAIATGKGRNYFEVEIQREDIQDLFLTTRCGDEAFSKPNPQMLLDIINELGVTSEQTLMVGDSEYDLMLAANAGVDALAVNYGLQKESKLLRHDVKGCISNVRELPAWLSKGHEAK